VQAAINAASGQLPKNLPSPPTYRKVNPADSPILLLSATSDTLPLTTVSDAVDAQLAQQISQISGVAQVTIAASKSRRSVSRSIRQKLVAKGCRWRCAQPDRDHDRRQSEGQHRRRDARLHNLRQRPVADSKDWNDVIVAYRNGGPCGSAISARP